MVQELEETRYMEDRERYREVKAVRLKNYCGGFNFYCFFDVVLHRVDSGGFYYELLGEPFRSSCRSEVISIHYTPEGAWQAKTDAEEMLGHSCWRLDREKNCMVDPEGICYSVYGREL
ncbi:MAG: hypothetical protein NC306_15170 [Butyrivibrio sp.]|nr:hypothetical protein [Butyrivibrio sp.]